MSTNNNLKHFIANKVKRLLEANHIKSQTALSQLLGFGTNFISNLVNEKALPTIDRLDVLCNHFGITLADFFKPNYSKDKSTDALVKLSAEKLDAEDLTLLYDLIASLDKTSLRALLKTYSCYHEAQNKK